MQSTASTIQITLPDGSQRGFDAGVTLTAVAEAIGPGLAKAALAAVVDGQLVDLSATLDRDAEVRFLTWRDEDGQKVYRHSTAHVLAQAVQRRFPKAKVAIGPPLDDGRFYYDFDVDRPFTPDDLEAIEADMGRIVQEDQAFRREVIDPDQARSLFAAEPYKLELIDDLVCDGQALSVYWNDRGDEPAWVDLCAGPAHLPSTGRIKAWKLLTSSGAYWRGDSDRPMLQRIYGTAFPSQKELDAWLALRAEAERRDHRRLGRELDLVWFNDVAPACPFFLPKGAFVYTRLTDLMRHMYRRYGYDEVITPQILSDELWAKSGHLEAYQENMYFTEYDNQRYAIKPMNCPSHVLLFNSKLRSYRDLPIRYADFGRLHRLEASGVTAGLTRVRSFAQDDAHIFCRPDQIGAEINAFIDMLLEVYDLLAFTEVEIALSTRPEKSVGSDEVWAVAESTLRDLLDARGVAYRVDDGEGAFYGPKIDFMVADALGRRHQLGTCQLDFSMPARLGAEYVTAEDDRATPVMIHRAVLGSLERFIGILIEHTAGAFPVWLAPEQARLVPIAQRHVAYAEHLLHELRALDLRAMVDAGDERMSAKIAAAEADKVPYMLVVGDREVEHGQVSVRERGMNNLGAQDWATFRDRLVAEAAFPPPAVRG